MGIISNREIWASDFRFMDDSQDFRYGISIYKDAAAKVVAKYSDSVERILDRVIELLDTEGLCVYITSFSARQDDSSQWHRYAGPNGVAIGFNRRNLERLTFDVLFGFGMIEYDIDRKIDELNKFIHRSLSIYDKVNISREDVERIARSHLRSLVGPLSYSKDVSFEAEREWRASAFGLAASPKERFRSTVNGLVPYIAVTLDNSDICTFNQLIENVVVGPGRFRDENIYTVKRYLLSKSINCAVIKSLSPVRL